MYDYGWRQYMPDIGRWNGMDQLAEKYRSTSPYGYVMNKPIMFTDPDGRYASQIQDLRNSMPNVYSGWENAQGVNFGDWNNFSNGSQFNEFVSQINASGLGGGGYTFTGNAAGSMYNYFANGGNINGISFKNGWAMWGTLEGNPYVVGYDGDMYLSDTGSVVLHRAKVENNFDSNEYWGLLNGASTTQSYSTNGIGITLGTTAQISNDLVKAGKMIKTPNIFRTYNLYRSNGYLNGNRYISGVKFMNNVKAINTLNNSKVVKGVAYAGLLISAEQFRVSHHPGYITRGIFSFATSFIPYAGPVISVGIDNTNVNYWNIWTWGAMNRGSNHYDYLNPEN